MAHNENFEVSTFYGSYNLIKCSVEYPNRKLLILKKHVLLQKDL